MLTLSEEITLHVSMSPIDMRCGIDRLVIRVAEIFSKEPQSASCFIFYNKGRNRIKCLMWDGNGFVLLHKRIERGRFCFPKQFDNETLTINHQQLQGLLYGFDFIRMKDYPNLSFDYYF